MNPGLEFRDLMEKLEGWMAAKGLTESSAKAFRWVSGDFLKYCAARGKPASKELVLDYMRDIGVSSGHKRWRWYVLKTCFKIWGLDWFSKEEESRYMPKPQERVNRPVLSLEEFEKLRAAADEEWLLLVIWIIAETGARRKQVVDMLREHFDPARGTLYIPPLKRGLDRVELLSEELASRLSSYLAGRSDGDPHLIVDEKGRPLTPDRLSARFKALAIKAGVWSRGLGLHALRRSWCTWLYEAGMRELEIQRAGGWKTPSMVAIYTSLSPAKAALKEAELHPLKRRKMGRSAAGGDST